MICTYVFDPETDEAAVYGADGKRLLEDSSIGPAAIARATTCQTLELREVNLGTVLRCRSIGEFGGALEECELHWPDEFSEEIVL